MREIIDLSHSLNHNMPVFPGSKSPLFIPTAKLEDIGYRELFINIQSHTGTHVDVPAHLLKHGKSLSDFNVDKFCGRAYVLKHSEDNPITIEGIDKLADILNTIDYVLVRTDWDRFWGQEAYFSNFPTLNSNVLNYLCRYNLKGVGVDAISVDPINSNLPNHNTLLSREMIIVENLTNLSDLTNKVFDFYCLPLPIANGDGSPVRAIAHIIP